MKALFEDEIGEVISRALESMAFILAESGDVSGQELSNHAHIGFSGPDEESHVFLSASDEFLLELASNLIGVEPEHLSLENEGLQALQELANVVCGEIVLLLGATETDFRIGLPRQLDGEPDRMTGDANVECELESDGGRLRVLVSRNSS